MDILKSISLCAKAGVANWLHSLANYIRKCPAKSGLYTAESTLKAVCKRENSTLQYLCILALMVSLAYNLHWNRYVQSFLLLQSLK